MSVEHFRHRPQQTQYKQDAHERWQMGDGLEDWHEDESAHAKEEHHLALRCRQSAGSHRLCLFSGEGELSLQMQREDIGRDEHGDERRNEDFRDDAACRDDALVPEHDGRHVADGREGTARVGCDDDERGVDNAVALVADQLA